MRIIFLSALVTLFLVNLALAAFQSSKNAPAITADSNPAPMADDITVPLPCDEKLILRGVSISPGALMWDKTFTMGMNTMPEEFRNIYEKKYTGHIAGAFTAKNLPADWRKSLANQPLGPTDTWYFIGKYELTNNQWQSVMDALDNNGNETPQNCPRKDAKDANQPVTGISWFETQEFLNKYNTWLVKNHASALPSFSNTSNIAFFRLPTEEEWEYAARGGGKVPEEWWESNDIFPFEKERSLEDYGFYQSGQPRSAPAAIGKRSPNPLGLYDTVGNVREMVDGFFRMTIADLNAGPLQRRLHGAVGGFVSKGGSFRSGDTEVLPGARDEKPLYTASGPYAASDLGLRLVLAGLNIPDADKKEALQKEQTSLPPVAQKKQPTVDVSGDDPMQALAKLAAAADEDLKKNLTHIRSQLKEKENAQAGEDARQLERSLRSLLYQAETLRAFAYRYVAASDDMAEIKKLAATANEKDRKTLQKLLQESQSDLKDYKHTLEMSANYYKTNLANILNGAPDQINRALTQLGNEYSSDSIFDKHMRQNLDILKKYLNQLQQKGPNSLSQRQIIKGILPSGHFDIIYPKG